MAFNRLYELARVMQFSIVNGGLWGAAGVSQGVRGMSRVLVINASH